MKNHLRENEMDKIVVLITSLSKEEAEAIGHFLVERRLAACANLLPGITSIFSWEGKICTEREFLLILKSKRSLFEKLKVEVKKLHSYSVPEIIALPIVAGSEEYLNWLQENTQ